MVEDTASPRRPTRVHLLTLLVAVAGLIVVATASLLAASVHRHTEQRLLDLQAKQARAVLTTAVGTVNALLAPTAELAARTDGNEAAFASSVGPFVQGDTPQFVSASLWAADDPSAPLHVVGEDPAIIDDPARLASMLSVRARRAAGSLFQVSSATSAARRFGYGLGSQGSPAEYVVYVESLAAGDAARCGAFRGRVLEPRLRDLLRRRGERGRARLTSSVQDLPVTGRTSTVEVPFGDASLLLVVTPTTTLSGGLSDRLPWIIALVGSVLTFGIAGLVERLLRRRDAALDTARTLAALSDENAVCTRSSADRRDAPAQPAARPPADTAPCVGGRAVLAGGSGQ